MSPPDSPAADPPGTHAARSSFWADLRAVLAERDFRKLYTTRLVSQTGDGIFTAGLGTYVFFNASTFPSPAAAAVAFAVLYLPYSFIGPFAGVFIDRWSRRQILVWSALTRFVFVAATAALVGSGTLGVPLYIAALLVLGVNRFFLSALSAALPHVISSDKLVMANSVGPTSGTVVAFIGGILGTGVHLATGGGHLGSAATLLVAGVCYACAGLTATRMPRTLLGPAGETLAAATAHGIGTEMASVARGLAAGLGHVLRRRRAAAALGATGAHRFLYGILFLMSLLLYRNYFYKVSGSNAALGHFLLIVIASALGYGAAAVVTPIATRRLTKPAWVAVLLAVGGVATAVLGAGFRQPGFLVISFLLGVTAQGVAICATTILQQEIGDDFRGRVFSLYDMLFNGAFVAGAAITAGFLPKTGRSYAMLLTVAIGYLIAAAGYWLASRQPGSSPGSAAGPAPSADAAPSAGAAGSPASAAQPSSS